MKFEKYTLKKPKITKIDLKFKNNTSKNHRMEISKNECKI